MSLDPSHDITRLLRAVSDGEPRAADALLSLVYEELRVLAHRQRAGWNNVQTLNTTALVHEAYLKLVDQNAGVWNSRAHFYGVAARAMRNIRRDYARARKAQKRGGDRQRVTYIDHLIPSEEAAREILALDAALTELEALSPRSSSIIECRYFAGLSIDETAAVLDLSPSTVKRSWRAARSWLHETIRRELA